MTSWADALKHALPEIAPPTTARNPRFERRPWAEETFELRF